MIDCSPYGPGASYCLVSDAAKSGINCLYPESSGGIGMGSIADCYYYENENTRRSFLPPLFQAELYEGELPENCSFMRVLSEKLKEDPELGRRMTKKIMETVGCLSVESWPSMRRWRYEEEWQIDREELFIMAGVSGIE